MFKVHLWLVALIMLLGLAACNGQPAASPAPVETASSTPDIDTPDTDTADVDTPDADAAETPPAAEDALPVDSASPDVAALCSEERVGATLYVSAENGFCLLYPSELTLEADMFRPDEAIQWRGSVADPTALESAAVSLRLAYNGPADGLDSDGYAAMWLEISPGAPHMDMSGLDLPREDATIGGEPAVILHDVPGMMFSQRRAFVVANRSKYQLELQPQPDDVPELAAEAEAAWDTITASLVFFPPQHGRPVARPDDVCPYETSGLTLLVDLAGGYCLLHPDDFAPDPMFPGRIAGGPELGPYEGFDSIQASLTIGAYELGARTPEEALQPFSEQVDPDSIENTTIGVYPAVIFDFTGGPWRQRNATIVVDGSVYTFVAQPWDAEIFPDAMRDVAQLWTLATESIAFFDKWR